jgi:hypothetical protein
MKCETLSSFFRKNYKLTLAAANHENMISITSRGILKLNHLASLIAVARRFCGGYQHALLLLPVEEMS